MKTFIEIGSSYWDTLNYLSDYGWRGVIVEPIKNYIDKIEQKQNIFYLNFAIDTQRGHRDIWLVTNELIDSGDLDYTGMSSFYKDVHVGTPIGNEFKSHIHDRSLKINTLVYQDIIDMCNISQVDYLKIDTEGHDWEILKQVHMIGPLRPSVIKVEHKHSQKHDLMKQYLSSNGYQCESFNWDIMAIDVL